MMINRQQDMRQNASVNKFVPVPLEQPSTFVISVSYDSNRIQHMKQFKEFHCDAILTKIVLFLKSYGGLIVDIEGSSGKKLENASHMAIITKFNNPIKRDDLQAQINQLDVSGISKITVSQ